MLPPRAAKSCLAAVKEICGHQALVSGRYQIIDLIGEHRATATVRAAHVGRPAGNFVDTRSGAADRAFSAHKLQVVDANGESALGTPIAVKASRVEDATNPNLNFLDAFRSNKMNMKKLAFICLTSGVLGAAALPAHAELILTLDDGAGHTTTVNDGGTGMINWSGMLGAWSFNATAGYANRALGEPPSLDLSSLNVSSAAGGLLTITLTDTGLTFAGPNASATTSVGGVTSGTVSFNSLFNGTSLGLFGPFSGGAFSGTTSTSVNTNGTFSLTQIAQINHTGSGNTSFNIITQVPEPATLGLLGLGLVGLGFARRNKAKQ